MYDSHIEFREDVFRRIVKRGTIYDNGEIIYELIFDIMRKEHIS